MRLKPRTATGAPLPRRTKRPSPGGSNEPADLFQPGVTCWRVERAHRAKVLVDGAAYFGALRAALLRAERRVFILGWDIDSRVALRGEAETPNDGAPLRLREFLNYLVRRRPELIIRLLPWDYSVLFALEREPLPELNLDWMTPAQIKVCLDDALPLGGAHHQKIVVIDDAIAFSGGLDLTIRRWDTPAHAVDDPLRRDPSGQPYRPFHDVQICVDGDAARAMAELARERWLKAADEPTQPVSPSEDPWPPELGTDFQDVDVAVARTVPADGNGAGAGTAEVLALFSAAIEQAEKCIYIENQFFTSDTIALCLAERMRQKPELQAVLVAPKDHETWVEARSMKAGRIRFWQHLCDAGVSDRVRLLYPFVADGGEEQPILVHAKVMIVDDRLLRVGSANLNNRSMGTDTECDLAIEATQSSERNAIASVRNRLLAEHLGVSEGTVAETLASTGSLLRTVDRLGGSDRGLRAIDDRLDVEDTVAETVSGLADPAEPVAASRLVGDVFEGEPSGRVGARMFRLLLAGGLLLAAAIAWWLFYEPGLVDPLAVGLGFQALSQTPWAHLLVPLIYLIGSLVLMPLTVLIALTAMAFPPWSAFFHAGLGSLLSAVLTYYIGAFFGRQYLRQKMGTRLNRISRAMARRGVISVIAVRVVPLAPFTIINMIAGVSHIRFFDYVVGTALGMMPGILMLTAMGHQLAETLVRPTASGIALLGMLVALWIGLSLALQALMVRINKAR